MVKKEYIKTCSNCGGIKNLEFIPWEENVKKRTKCSITINELINN